MIDSDRPDLGLVAFRVDDQGDHPGGGHCVSLSQSESDGTRELLEQYLAALAFLADRAADEPNGGWTFTRPLLFYAHHTAELAVKLVLLTAGVAFERIHGLDELWGAVVAEGLDRSVVAVDTGWCRDYVTLVADLAGKSIGARYARPNRGHAPIDEVWCCANPFLLAAAAEHFAVQCIAIAETAHGAATSEA